MTPWQVTIFDRTTGRVAYHETRHGADPGQALDRLHWLWSLSACPTGRFIGWVKEQGACGWVERLGFDEVGTEKGLTG